MEPAVTPEIVAEHGLTPEEFARLAALLGRPPSWTELGIVSAMWNEHCSYKSSKRWLRTLHTTGPQVVIGPGENAGVVDLGDGDVLVFKMESHNHPSFIEPYQGAATGVGGILRDVFTMGARPIAAMNALSFGRPEHPRTRRLLAGAVAGIGGYANAFGVPTVGGELRFHPSYDGNCLVNAFAAGLARRDAIFTSAASGVGMPVVYLGARTGRDGVGGATMASAEFGAAVEEKRPTVQIGDPFTEKRLLEACLELMAAGAVISIQDMGAAGLTCSAVEMGDKGGLGIRLELDRVPLREPGMSAYEIMLSESQERMLMVLRPEAEAAARAIFAKWDLDFAIVGETIPEDRFLVLQGNAIKADLPLSKLSSEAPDYDRPWVAPPPPPPLPERLPEIGALMGLRRLLADPNHAWKGWVWQQYDSQVGADTLRTPGRGAGVVRVHGTAKAVAFTCDVTPRYVAADPREGGRQAVAEAWRNLVAVGARPLAATDNLNFGNPERPEIMGSLVLAIGGIAEACRALDFPIVSGNVSLYNETAGRAILPTPTIGGVGLIAAPGAMIAGPARAGDLAVLLGGEGRHLGQSALLAALGIEAGPPPPVDLAAERAHGEFVLAARPLIRDATDLSDGGLAVAAFELAEAAGLGVAIADAGLPALFGEDQGRYLLAVDPADLPGLEALAAERAVDLAVVGRFGGAELRLGDEAAPMAELVAAWRGGLAAALGL
jgi:phosphoribosylformylglycinamidine synthase